MEQRMTGNEVRKRFLDFFTRHGHRRVRSASLVPQDDPTLLFTNAGMVPFKRVFIGEEKRDYIRATSSQKCVRAGGKHNDLENVGYTARHHTFFEMLGNFSFGDYFKEEAIELAWDLLTNGYRLPTDKLWISIYLDDDEAFDIWHQKIGIPAERIVRLGEKDNFWSMGDTGPCGPCSEIHIDRGEEYGCGREDCAVGCDCDRYLEIWNLVFMQFNRDESGHMEPLPKPSIDTGMGLERLVSVIQNAPTNYETDLFLPIIGKVEELAGQKLLDSRDTEVAMKVIADHSRAAAFLIGDGILPSNEGRGYVLRRIMRRAIRYGRYLGLTQPFLHETARVVFDIMKPAYPELIEASAFITNIIQNEERRFSETLDHGLKLLDETLSDMTARGVSTVPGDVIFKLYDTYGFPVDIIQDVVKDKGILLDMDGFERDMQAQKEQSRSKTKFSHINEAYRKLSAEGIKTEFVGYDRLACDTKVLTIVADGQETEEAVSGQDVEIVTAQTPFYGEAGGQAGDCGKITADGLEIDMTETVKDPTGLTIHKGRIVSGTVKKGMTVHLAVDAGKRAATACNHTATHVLHAVLRNVLGDHVKQSGSLVSPDRLRFDFTHFSRLERDTLDAIEKQVNARIRENAMVTCDEMDAEEAFQTGATALFEEKYGDRVRVVSLSDFSKEFCGGTHTAYTGDIGLFKIVSESGIAAGVRRIEALTGDAALAHMQQTEGYLEQTARLLKDKPEAVLERVERLLDDQKVLEKELEKLKAQMASASLQNISDETKTVNGISLIAKTVKVDKPGELRDLADKFKDRIKSGVVALGAVSNGKALLIAVVTRDLTDRFHAGKLIKAMAAEVGGGGGGRPDMAQAGGTQPEHLDKALAKAEELIKAVTSDE
jgi:alanyl-tRNA synthetase